MNRAKDVHHIICTVYKDFEENGKKYKGSSNTSIHPSMNDGDIEEVIREAVYAAGFVRNEYYHLVESSIEIQPMLENKFNNDSMSNWMPKFTNEIFLSDKYENGWINSAELFLDKVNTRIVNSKGMDIAWKSYRGELEFITTWKEEREEIDLYEDILFSDYDKAAASSIYEETSTSKINENIQGNEVKGDKVNIALDPYLDNSTASSPYDEDGILKRY